MKKFVDEIVRRRQILDNPSFENVASPFLWPGVERASEIIVQNLLAGRHVHVWGDYDADGVTAASLCVSAFLCLRLLNGFKSAFSFHLPDRIREGYGLNEAGVKRAADMGANLLLTVDCGTGSSGPVELARKLGMETIVTDHHEPGDALPPADAICNPMLSRDPGLNVAGVGQAFILVLAVCETLAQKGFAVPDPLEFLDLVATGSIADVSTMSRQNHILCRLGLKQLGDCPRPGLAALKNVAGMSKDLPVTAKDVGFSLGPRINAAGRMESAQTAFSCMMARKPDEAWRLAARLDHLNSFRKEVEADIAVQAEKQARSLLGKRSLDGLVIYGPDWNPGVIGIAASRVADIFGMPVVILAGQGEILRGSGRGAGADLHLALSECGDALRSFGGHRSAAGLSLERKKLDLLRQLFSEACGRQRPGGGEPTFVAEKPSLETEGFFPCGKIDSGGVAELYRLEPFGPGNPAPLFRSEPMIFDGLENRGKMTILHFYSEDMRSDIPVKKFNFHDCGAESHKGRRVALSYTPQFSYFRGEADISLDVAEIVAVN